MLQRQPGMRRLLGTLKTLLLSKHLLEMTEHDRADTYRLAVAAAAAAAVCDDPCHGRVSRVNRISPLLADQ